MRFFNRFRMRAMNTQRFGRYLLYASGEIILVVIGIFLAIQVNSIYEREAEKRSNRDLLLRMIAELDQNEARLNYLEFDHVSVTEVYSNPPYQQNKIGLDSCEAILSRGITSADLDYLVASSVFNFSGHNLYRAVYDEMLNTGKIYGIGSEKLIGEIHRYYKVIDRENRYQNQQIARVLNLKYECKYGWNAFKNQFREEGVSALASHPWIYDKNSAHFVDFQTYVQEAHIVVQRNLERLENIRRHSDTLRKLVRGNL